MNYLKTINFASLSFLFILSGNAHANKELELDAQPHVSVAPAIADPDKKEDKKQPSTLGTLAGIGTAALENVGGLEGVKTLASEYMALAKEVEAKVKASQDARIANGQTANKFTEIVARAKEAPTMLAFVGKKVILPFFKAIFKFW